MAILKRNWRLPLQLANQPINTVFTLDIKGLLQINLYWNAVKFQNIMARIFLKFFWSLGFIWWFRFLKIALFLFRKDNCIWKNSQNYQSFTMALLNLNHVWKLVFPENCSFWNFLAVHRFYVCLKYFRKSLQL